MQVYLPSLFGRGRYFLPYVLIEMLLHAAGYPVVASELLSIVKRGEYDRRNVNLLDLMDLIKAVPYEVYGCQFDPSILTAQDLPLLAQIHDGDDFSFVVLVPSQVGFRAFDGVKGWLEIGEEEIRKRCTGAALSPIHKLRDKEEVRLLYEQEQTDHNYMLLNMCVADKVFSLAECQAIIKMADSRWQRSRVNRNSNPTISDQRTSFSAMLGKASHLQLAPSITAKLNGLVPLISESDIESLQCVRYQSGQEYKPHLDISVESKVPAANRWWTALLYLNDDYIGGETYFPVIDRSVRPESGRVLIFRNRKSNGMPLISSLHAGQPVIEGDKYVCNIWISKPSGSNDAFWEV